jgi:ABC-type Na+ transport system ATPase subunit NatA
VRGWRCVGVHLCCATDASRTQGLPAAARGAHAYRATREHADAIRRCCAAPLATLRSAAADAATRSTLLDTIAGRLSPGATLAGSIKVNGHAVNLAYGRSAYVTQDEVLIGTLTVRETILYAARLRLRSAPGEPTPAEVADGVVAELGLTEAANTVIGNWHMRGVSGGQRRRVVIGCELVVSPSLIFLDEPTSGAASRRLPCLHVLHCG